jgi:hypothetical protein
MAITKPKPKNTPSVDKFILGAPDADVKPRGVKKGNKQQISLTIAPSLLMKVDELAAELGQSRAAIINMAVYRAVEHGLIIDGLRKE